MIEELSILINQLNNPLLSGTEIIHWGCPVPSFGNLSTSNIATLGLNPSNREFVDIGGKELIGQNRRFHTLNSLGITNWSEANKTHLQQIIELCNNYFSINPYDGWFKKLDYIISGTKTSYYFPSANACHLDIIPFATACKWTELSSQQRSALLELSGDTLGMLIKNSPIRILILNGKTVVENFQTIAKTRLKCESMPDWTLPRKINNGVQGFAYSGVISNIGEVKLNRKLLILGYNHNLQSSYGVTKAVQFSIRNWVTQKALEISL